MKNPNPISFISKSPLIFHKLISLLFRIWKSLNGSSNRMMRLRSHFCARAPKRCFDRVIPDWGSDLCVSFSYGKSTWRWIWIWGSGGCFSYISLFLPVSLSHLLSLPNRIKMTWDGVGGIKEKTNSCKNGFEVSKTCVDTKLSFYPKSIEHKVFNA